jgi:hypothetical protein
MATVTAHEAAPAAEQALPVEQARPSRPVPRAQAAPPGENASVFCEDWFAVRVWALCVLLMVVLLVVEFLHGLVRW